MSYSKSCRQSEDLISNVPGNVADEILERLPILMAAETSVLSKQWRHNWLSLKRLVFDTDFWSGLSNEDESSDCEFCCNTISSILLHHIGPIHEFHLYIPPDVNIDVENLNLSQWLSFLSRNGVKNIVINNSSSRYETIASYIFSCTELVQLTLVNYRLNSPPIGVIGFPNLRQLVLLNIKFAQSEMFCCLIANCRQLTSLRLENWIGMDHIVIDVPSLKTLTVKGFFKSLTFRNVRRLKFISLLLVTNQSNLTKAVTSETVQAFNRLASSCQLECIQFAGLMCQFLAVGCIKVSTPVAFNHLNKLCLTDIDLADSSIFRFLVCTFVISCPNTKELELSVVRSKHDIEHKFEFNTNYEMAHLIEFKITKITGSSAELKLIEYLLTISVVLEKLLFKCDELDSEAELIMSRALMGFTRASPKARVLCMKK